MKIFLALLMLIPCTIFPQEIENKSQLDLENQFKVKTNFNSPDYNSANNVIEKSKKSVGLAIIYSLLLPGMGELYADSYSSGKYFTIAEGAIWITYIGMNSYGNWQKDRYTSFAASNGGVNTAGKDEDYFATISEYTNVEEYNTEKALERNFSDMYTSANYKWDWKTSDNRKTYRSMWVSSEQAFNNLRFVVGAMLINRVASAINAVRLVASHNKSLTEEVSWGFSAGIDPSVNRPASLIINFHTAF